MEDSRWDGVSILTEPFRKEPVAPGNVQTAGDKHHCLLCFDHIETGQVQVFFRTSKCFPEHIFIFAHCPAKTNIPPAMA